MDDKNNHGISVKTRKINLSMNMLMGFTMSIILSFVGTVTSRHFSFGGWFMSFGISFLISLVIGFFIPIKPLGDKACGLLKTKPESFKGNLISAMVSNLIYTPLITVIMVVTMLNNAAKNAPEGADIPTVGQVLPGSLLICFIVGYIVIVIAMPIFIKLVLGLINKGARR